MTNVKAVADRIVTGLAVVVAPVLTALVDWHALTATQATDLGGVVSALVVGYHGGHAVANRQASSTPPGPHAQSLMVLNPVSNYGPTEPGATPGAP